jgi:predicted DsbA family dithiol-disulfide isomerase
MSTAPVQPAAAPEARLALEVWTDLTCPWCYLGKRRLERAITAFEHPHAVQVRYRSFERGPWAGPGEAARLGRYGARPRPEAARAAAEATEAAQAAAEEGLVLHPEHVVPASSFDAHRLVHLAEAEGGLALQAAVAERMFAAYFCEGKALDDLRVLQRVGPEAGLDEHRVAAVLAGDEYALAVREDEREAARLQIATVPFVLADRRIAKAGPQPVEVLLGLLREAWQARAAGGSSG